MSEPPLGERGAPALLVSWYLRISYFSIASSFQDKGTGGQEKQKEVGRRQGRVGRMPVPG